MRIVKVDSISFNVDAVKTMSKEAFIEAHFHIGKKAKGLSDEDAKRWASDTFDVLTSEKPDVDETKKKK